MKAKLLAVLPSLLWIAACASDEEPSQSPPKRVRVAACQIRSANDFATAYDAIDAALAEAKRKGAEIACFPETALLGWVNPEAHSKASPVPGDASTRLAGLARRHAVMIAIGLAEREGGKLYDSAILIDRDGTLLLRHRKSNILSELMKPSYTPGHGAGDSVVTTRYGRIGLLICADTFKDDLVASIASSRADLLLVPYGWAAPAEKWPDHGKSLHGWVAHTARRAKAPVVGVNCTGKVAHGPWTHHVYGGQSVVCTDDGEVQGILADRAEEVRVFDLPLR